MTEKSTGRIWVGQSGAMIVARLRGAIAEHDIPDLQDRVLRLLSETGLSRILYDGLEMDDPGVGVTLSQQESSDELYRQGARVAILVPNSRIAYLARIAFGQGEHKVIYNDLAEAVSWLTA